MVVVTIVKSNEQFTKLLSRSRRLSLSTSTVDSTWLLVSLLVEDVGNVDVVRFLLEGHVEEIKFELLLALFLFLSRVVVVVVVVVVAALKLF